MKVVVRSVTGKEFIMNRKIYWMILLNPLFLILYGYGLSVVSAFCKYGNVTKRLPLIAEIFLAGILWFIVWTILYFVLKKIIGPSKKAGKVHWILAAECAALILTTGYYGVKIYDSAQPYNGKLSSYLSDLKKKRSFALEDSQRDFPEEGLDGILGALSEHCGLDTDWDLYMASTLTLGIDEKGTIQSLEAFLYAFDEAGDFHSWLISYDADKSEKMTVYLDGNADTTYMDQEQMEPLFLMIDALRNSDLPASYGVTENDVLFTLKYSGYTDGNYGADNTESWYLATEGNEETGRHLTDYTPILSGNTDRGFLLTLYYDDSKLVTIITNPGSLYTIPDLKEKEEKKSEIENAKEQGSTLVSDDDGMTFYLDETTSMRLIVTDAAAGSRFYAFQNGSIYNEDPFDGNIGVAESIYFLDESVGFILLQYASQDCSQMYYTQDGGVTFSEVVLPVSDGEEDMAGNDLGYTSENMDYIDTPYEENGRLYVAVSYDYSGARYMSLLFVSEDLGQSWQYLSYEEAE
jgi:hypothetical protein